MSSTSVTLHKSNISNFETFTIDILALGSVYNPAKPSIKPDALNLLLNKSKAADAAEITALITMNAARTARIDVFNRAPDVITRSLNYVRLMDAPENTKEELIGLAYKFLGRTKAVTKETTIKTAVGEETTTTKTHTSSPGDMDSKLGYLDTYIKQLITIKAYAPNEANIKTDALTALLTEMKTKRTAEITAEAAHNNTIIARNDIMYADVTGIIDVTNDVKAYIKVLFGASSPQYRELTSLKFKKG